MVIYILEIFAKKLLLQDAREQTRFGEKKTFQKRDEDSVFFQKRIYSKKDEFTPANSSKYRISQTFSTRIGIQYCL